MSGEREPMWLAWLPVVVHTIKDPLRADPWPLLGWVSLFMYYYMGWRHSSRADGRLNLSAS